MWGRRAARSPLWWWHCSIFSGIALDRGPESGEHKFLYALSSSKPPKPKYQRVNDMGNLGDLAHVRMTLGFVKRQLTPIFNLPSACSTIPVHYVGTSFRTQSCSILNKLTKIIRKILRWCWEKPKLTYCISGPMLHWAVITLTLVFLRVSTRLYDKFG